MTDILEKCARAAFETDTGGKYERYDPFKAQNRIVRARFEAIARAVIAAVADGVTEEMCAAAYEAWHSPERSDPPIRKALAAALRAAIPEGK